MSEVEIHHPQWGRTMQVPADLFPGRLAGKGWQLVASSPAPATPAEQDEVLDEKDQFRRQLEASGVVVDGRWGLKRLRAEVANLAGEDTE